VSLIDVLATALAFHSDEPDINTDTHGQFGGL